jgi:hypothetical protein
LRRAISLQGILGKLCKIRSFRIILRPSPSTEEGEGGGEGEEEKEEEELAVHLRNFHLEDHSWQLIATCDFLTETLRNGVRFLVCYNAISYSEVFASLQVLKL